MKKKILFLVVALLLAITCTAFVACNDDSDATNLRVVLPDGTPLLAMANIMNGEKTIGKYNLDINVIPATNIATEVGGGKADLAIIPTNAAAALYMQAKNKGVSFDYQLLTSNIFGVLYLIGNADVDFSLEKLKGTVIYSIGANNTPQLVFEKILKTKFGDIVETGTQAVSGKIVINYVTDGQQVIAGIASGKASYGLVGEPAVTNAKAAKGYAALYDLQAGWEEVTGGKEKYPQASLIIKKSLAKDKTFVNALVQKLNSNLTFLANETNLKNLTSLFSEYGSAVTFPKAAVANCNIDVKWAKDIKIDIETYLIEFPQFASNLPGDDFYYGYTK